MQSGRFVWADSEGRDAKRDLRAGGLSGIHPTREGDIYISAHSSHFWQALCELVGLPELAEDPRYDTLAKRADRAEELRSEEHTSELQSLMRISYAVFCLKKKKVTE